MVDNDDSDKCNDVSHNSKIQGDRYRIWNLGPFLKKHYKGKNHAFGTKSGLFGTIFGPFSGLLVVIYMKMQKTCEKGKKRVVATFPISKYI